MPSKMIACPHCGALNSERKAQCYGCEQPLHARTRPRATARLLRAQDACRNQAGRLLARRPSRLPGLVGVTLRQRAQLFRQFQHLLLAGIPVGLALHHLRDNVAAAMRPLARDLAESTEKGRQLWESMELYPAVFAEWEIHLVRAAEQSGGLPEAMGTIADTLEIEMQLRYETGAKLLPMKATFLVFLLTMLIVFSVSSAAGDLSAVLARVGWAVVTVIQLLLAFYLLRMAWRFFTRTRRGGRVAQAIVTHAPMIGPIIRLQMLHRFITVLAALWKAGIGPADAMQSAARAANNPYLLRRIDEQRDRLSHGSTLAEVLANTQAIPREVISMVNNGEISGTVAESLEHTAGYLRLELEGQMKTLPIRAQLLMYATVGVGIAAFIIWFWTSYFASLPW